LRSRITVFLNILSLGSPLCNDDVYFLVINDDRLCFPVTSQAINNKFDLFARGYFYLSTVAVPNTYSYIVLYQTYTCSYQMHYTVCLLMNKARVCRSNARPEMCDFSDACRKCIFRIRQHQQQQQQQAGIAKRSQLSTEQFFLRADNTDRPLLYKQHLPGHSPLSKLAWRRVGPLLLSTASLGLCTPPPPPFGACIQHGAWDRVPELTTASPYVDSRVNLTHLP
jgi:hypothetical protein